MTVKVNRIDCCDIIKQGDVVILLNNEDVPFDEDVQPGLQGRAVEDTSTVMENCVRIRWIFPNGKIQTYIHRIENLERLRHIF